MKSPVCGCSLTAWALCYIYAEISHKLHAIMMYNVHTSTKLAINTQQQMTSQLVPAVISTHTCRCHISHCLHKNYQLPLFIYKSHFTLWCLFAYIFTS